MRLIDAPIGIFRFDGELVLKTEYYSENKRSGKYIPDCYIVRTGEYFWGGAKTANELINLDVEPVDFAELLPTVTDTISRQAAMDAIEFGITYAKAINKETGEVTPMFERENKALEDAVERVRQLPPAEPKTGKWVDDGDLLMLTCGNCGYAVMRYNNTPFCPNCGTNMDGKE